MTTPTPSSRSSALFGMSALTSLFFMWGFITSMNDVLIPHLKGVFELSYTQAMLVQFCFFSAYFLISVPAGKLVNALGFQKGISIGLATACVGCLMFIPAATLQQYWVFLSALFVLASGVTILQVAANPLVTLMGDPDTASSRLTLTQAFNSLGATLGPVIGGMLLFSALAHDTQATNADSVILPYSALAAVLFVLALLFLKLTLSTPQHGQNNRESVPSSMSTHSLLSHRHLTFGVIGIFVYVGAEVSIGSFLVNFLGEANIAGMSEAQASKYIAYYWGGALVGRFAGAAIMQKIPAGKLLSVAASFSVALLTLVVFSHGAVAMWAVLLVGLCNSIMFPTIFSLALKGLGPNTGKASGLLCLAIVGGALVPLLQGVIADTAGLQLSFLLPLVCYAYIAFYGIAGSKPAYEAVTITSIHSEGKA